jgi:imidazolonepropionase-like amidohydrolase
VRITIGRLGSQAGRLPRCPSLPGNLAVVAAFLASLTVLATAHAAAADAAPKTIVYLNATVIDGDPTTVRKAMAVVTRGEKITRVAPVDGFHPESTWQIVDVRGKFVIPGLINTHVHLATAADPPAARTYLRRELFSGVTTVRDMAGDSRLLVELKREAEFDEIVAPDIFFVALFAGPDFFADPRTHQAAHGRTAGEVPWMRAITRDTDLRQAVAEARGTGATAIKIYADLPAELVRAITVEAHRQNLLVWAHATVFPARPSEVVDAGVDVISHSCLLGYEISEPAVPAYAHRVPVAPLATLKANPKIGALMTHIRERGTILDATAYVFDSDPSPSCPQGAEDYLTQLAYKAGIPISVGTDDDLGGKGVFSDLDNEVSVLVKNVGMSTADVIRSATIIGARTMSLEKVLGTIEAGKSADFVVLAKNPLDDIDNIRTVEMVVKHGIPHQRSDFKPGSAE